VTIDFEGWYGAPLRDLFGGADFPAVGDDGRLTLTLGTQSFYWLHIGDATR
jgi:maltose alpha-D-glucosyltransferase/alpha-amylase